MLHLPGYGINELSVPRGWTDFLERRDKLLEALPIVIMGYWILEWSLQDMRIFVDTGVLYWLQNFLSSEHSTSILFPSVKFMSLLLHEVFTFNEFCYRSCGYLRNLPKLIQLYRQSLKPVIISKSFRKCYSFTLMFNEHLLMKHNSSLYLHHVLNFNHLSIILRH